MTSVVSAFYYLRVVKVMYFDEPAGKVQGKGDVVHNVLLFVSSLAISPFGYLLTVGLARLTASAATALLHAA